MEQLASHPSARAESEETPSRPGASAGTRWSVTGLTLALLLTGFIPALSLAQDDDAAVTREIIGPAVCGKALTVMLTVQPPAGTTGWTLDETPPDATTIGRVDPSDSGHAEDGNVMWRSTSGDDGVRSYEIQIPVTIPDGTWLRFTGEHRMDPSMADRAPIGGDDSIQVSCPGVARSMPSTATCGETVSVSLAVDPPEDTTSWLVEDAIPADWRIVDDMGALSVRTETGIRFTNAGPDRTTLVYEVAIPDEAQGTYELSGTYRYHPSMADRAPVTGPNQLTVECPDASTPAHDDQTPDPPRDGPEDPPSSPVVLGTEGGVAIRGSAPPGALATYTARILGKAGDVIPISLGDGCLARAAVELSDRATTATVDVTLWPTSSKPEGSPRLPSGVSVACHASIQATPSGSIEQTRLSFEIPPGSPAVGSDAVLLNATGARYNPAASVTLDEGGGELGGDARAACCGWFALAFDDTPPTVQAVLGEQPLRGQNPVTVLAVDNVAVASVELLVDGEPVDRDLSEPYAFQLETTAYENGPHEITIRAQDLAGHATEHRQAYTFSNAIPPSPTPQNEGQVGILDWILFALGGLVLAGGLVVGTRVLTRPPRDGADKAGARPRTPDPPLEDAMVEDLSPSPEAALFEQATLDRTPLETSDASRAPSKRRGGRHERRFPRREPRDTGNGSHRFEPGKPRRTEPRPGIEDLRRAVDDVLDEALEGEEGRP